MSRLPFVPRTYSWHAVPGGARDVPQLEEIVREAQSSVPSTQEVAAE